MAIFPGDAPKFWKFRRGGGGGKFLGPISENSEGRGSYGKSLPWGCGMDIFWNYTLPKIIVDLIRRFQNLESP